MENRTESEKAKKTKGVRQLKARKLVLGIDIGGTTTSFGLVDRKGEMHARATIATEPKQPAKVLVERIATEVTEMTMGHSPKILLEGVGIGAPNAHYLRGTIEHAVNLDWGKSVNLVELVRAHFPVPVAVTNDANAAALGELLFGAARNMRHFMVITLGTGFGSGIVVDSRVLYGAEGMAGELGHTVVDPAGRECHCGKRGCLETYVSATGLVRTLFALLAERRGASALRAVSYQEMTAKKIFDAALAGDALALDAFDRTARILGMKLADAVAHTNPQAIFLFGGLAAAGELLLTPAKRYFEEYLFKPFKGKVELQLSGLKGDSGAILGAAALAWQEIAEP